MSDQTTAALEAAIHTHIQDEHHGVLISEWVLICVGIEPGGERGDTLHIYEDNDLPSHHATGLLTRAINRIEHEEMNG